MHAKIVTKNIICRVMVAIYCYVERTLPARRVTDTTCLVSRVLRHYQSGQNGIRNFVIWYPWKLIAYVPV